MTLSAAEKIAFKSLLNAYFRECGNLQFNNINQQCVATHRLQPFNFRLELPVDYQSLTGRHQFAWPALLYTHETAAPQALTPWGLLGLIMQDLQHRHPQADRGQREFLQRFANSCENMEIILRHLSSADVAALFATDVDFQRSENGLISGHQLHPCPKSREGFTPEQFKRYSPELQHCFALHYFLADPQIIFTDSVLPQDANSIVRQHFLQEQVSDAGIVLPCHPWQAEYLQQLPTIRRWLRQGLLIDLGQQGHRFTATTSVRTVYRLQSPYMAKFSLNVAITNSTREQHSKELIRGVAAYRFWHSAVGKQLQQHYPHFNAIAEPAYLALRDGNQVIHASACLLRSNPFLETNNQTTSLATLCQDHPFAMKNRFSQLIPHIAQQRQLSLEQAACLWLQQFLAIAVEPILWLFVQHGVSIEPHQQNLLITLQDGLPVAAYCRDNQGYLVVDRAIPALSELIDARILAPFYQGDCEFIANHMIYYLICNSLFGVINAIGTAGVCSEQRLLHEVASFLQQCHQQWPTSDYFIPRLFSLSSLPFKGNLLTRFYQLDELTAPVEQQSVYINVANPFQGVTHDC